MIGYSNKSWDCERMDLSFFAHVDAISRDSPTHINASISLEECFCLTF